MKEQILPELPIVGRLKLMSRDGLGLCDIHASTETASTPLLPFFQKCFDELQAFLIGETTEINIPLDLSGLTPFHLRVLTEMKKIPYGQVATYRDLAIAINSKGYQAIGTACGRNPFLLIYPCHRVVGSHGLGGFAHGLEMKRALLELEARANPTALIAGKAQQTEIFGGGFSI